MKKPSETQRIPEPTKQAEGPVAGARSITNSELTEIEQRISAALHAEAAEAVDALGMGDVEFEFDASLTSGEDSFVDGLRAKWQAEANAAQEQPPGSPKRDGQTAILPHRDARARRGPLSLVADSWWAGAAAAAVLAGAVGLFGSSIREEKASNTSNRANTGSLSSESFGAGSVSMGTGTQYATYLGATDQPASSTEGEVSERGPSTVPRILPHTVDFSGDGSMAGTFRIEIHDTDRDTKIDDVPGAPFKVTVFEPRWICPEADRAKLPAVFWLKVFRNVDPPGSGAIYKELFARQ